MICENPATVHGLLILTLYRILFRKLDFCCAYWIVCFRAARVRGGVSGPRGRDHAVQAEPRLSDVPRDHAYMTSALEWFRLNHLLDSIEQAHFK